jgi:hypothetical protein
MLCGLDKIRFSSAIEPSDVILWEGVEYNRNVDLNDDDNTW